MNVKKFLESTKTAIEDINISPDNLVLAITKLLEITHAHGLDKEAIEALSECGITLEIDG